jgi:dihydroorotate dehydrogenase electron transfer subunit
MEPPLRKSFFGERLAANHPHAMGVSLRNQFTGEVAANVPLCREHYRLTIRVPDFPPTEPGQFVQLACRDMERDFSGADLEWQRHPASDPGDYPRGWKPLPHPDQPELAEPMAVLRRPFSLAGRRNVSGGVELDIIHRVVGVGTDWLSRLSIGQRVSVLGPLGNRFSLTDAGQTAVLVGGGVGIPPMLYLAERLAGRSAVAFCGALSRDLLPLTILAPADDHDAAKPAPIIEEFARHGIPSIVSTDDGSLGFRGYITQALERFLDAEPIPSAIIYTCGPEPMLRRVAQIAADRGLPCQVAVERAMACGMGTCQSCVIRVRRPSAITAAGAATELAEGGGRDWVYRLACTDGPIFDGEELLW